MTLSRLASTAALTLKARLTRLREKSIPTYIKNIELNEENLYYYKLFDFAKDTQQRKSNLCKIRHLNKPTDN